LRKVTPVKIRPRHLKAIDAMVRGQSLVKAAAAAGVSTVSLLRWRRDPDFQATYQDAVRRVFGAGLDRLQAVARRAVRTLHECLGAAKASDRIKAADRLLAHGLRAAELKDLAERVEALEKLLAERSPAPGPRANGAAVPHLNGEPSRGRS
jgi:hypothetical protein